LGEETNEPSIEEVPAGSSFIYPGDGSSYSLVINLNNEEELYDISV
jgi:hypothetical protein